MATRYSAETKAEARRLRAAGMSVHQIADALAVRSTSSVQRWVADIAPPDWTRRPNAKDELRERARVMRSDGMTYPRIAAELGVSKSSVSLWVRDLPHPPRDMKAGEAKRLAGHRAYFARRRAQVAAERKADKERWARSVGPLSHRELLLVGAALYWAEGSKAKEWRQWESVRFTNSDAAMITLFLAFLRALEVEPSRLRFAVQIHETADVAGAEAFWRDVVGGPSASFGKTSLKRHNPLTTRNNTGEAYHGCLRISVLRSAALYRKIEGIWWAASGSVPSNLSDPSRVV
jgi:transcriptional regulator with XRE-family HTH domain